MSIDPTFCGCRFSTGRLMAIEDFIDHISLSSWISNVALLAEPMVSTGNIKIIYEHCHANICHLQWAMSADMIGACIVAGDSRTLPNRQL